MLIQARHPLRICLVPPERCSRPLQRSHGACSLRKMQQPHLVTRCRIAHAPQIGLDTHVWFQSLKAACTPTPKEVHPLQLLLSSLMRINVIFLHLIPAALLAGVCSKGFGTTWLEAESKPQQQQAPTSAVASYTETILRRNGKKDNAFFLRRQKQCCPWFCTGTPCIPCTLRQETKHKQHLPQCVLKIAEPQPLGAGLINAGVSHLHPSARVAGKSLSLPDCHEEQDVAPSWQGVLPPKGPRSIGKEHQPWDPASSARRFMS